MARLKILAIAILALLLLISVLIWIAIGSNTGKRAYFSPSLNESSVNALSDLPFCSIGKQYGVSPSVLAGVVLAEKQLNRDWTDFIQDGLFTVFYYLFNEAWWQEWSTQNFELATKELGDWNKGVNWSKQVTRSGIIFSIGPSQITTRTALTACQNSISKASWCTAGTKRLIQALLRESESLEVSALILDVERQTHLQKTGIDTGSDPAKWATLYNFGGEIYRARFTLNPDRPPNGFGRWVGNNSDQIMMLLNCKNTFE